MEQPDRVAISDVARVAGVSLGTVSNVLNRPERVRPDTALKVKRAIEQLGFVPSAQARSLRSGALTAVGAIVLDIRNPFFTEALRGIEDAAEAVDWTLMLGSSDGRSERERRYLDLFASHRVAGVIAVPASDDLRPYLEAKRRGMSVVLLDYPSPSSELSSVAVDDVLGGRLAVEHLLSLGYRQVVMLNGSHAIRQCRDRSIGAKRALAAAGLGHESALDEVLVSSLNTKGGESAVRHWLESHQGRPPAALFCVNDLVALGALRALRKASISPSDCAIVGYDDLELAAELSTALTSIRQPSYQMGAQAAALLALSAASGSGHRKDKLGDKAQAVEHVLFAPELVVRASTRFGHPRADAAA
jgi:LacI family transcriptional regulator